MIYCRAGQQILMGSFVEKCTVCTDLGETKGLLNAMVNQSLHLGIRER